MIPQGRREAVRAALRGAFDARTAEGFEAISGGVSGALILRFEVAGRLYLLRLEPERVPLRHRQRSIDCMVTAAASGVAPAVLYADAADGVAIIDFVAAQPLSDHPGGKAGIVRELGEHIARVQATPLFPSLGEYPAMIGDKLASLSTSGLFAAGLLDAHAEGLARIQAGYPWDAAALVSSHNDPNPRNILFDGTRLWLIDWELAFRNDPLADVAILTTELAETPQLEDILLEATFGRTPDAAVHARLAVMRLLTRLFYGCIVLENFTPGPTPEASLAAFTPPEFRAAVADGRLTSGSPEVAYAFAKMSLAAFIDGLTAPGFDEALKRAGQT